MSEFPKKIKLMPDYECWCLWNLDPTNKDSYNINPDKLPISSALKEKLSKWDQEYQLTFNEEYPPNSGFKTSQDQVRHNRVGNELAQRLQGELGEEYLVEYAE